MKGAFITFEGGEGAGKSTQVKNLAVYLQKRGIETVVTREVGGCPSAEEIRALWLGAGQGHWDGVTEILLISAARREHLVKVIWPALQRGAWVISDRFMDSTRVYQGVAMGLGIDRVDHYYRAIAGKEFEPHLTLVLDLPVEAGLQRMKTRGGPDDRYQQQNIAFHQKLRDAYLDLARHYPERMQTIDASQNVDQVAAAVCEAVRRHFGWPS